MKSTPFFYCGLDKSTLPCFAQRSESLDSSFRPWTRVPVTLNLGEASISVTTLGRVWRRAAHLLGETGAGGGGKRESGNGRGGGEGGRKREKEGGVESLIACQRRHLQMVHTLRSEPQEITGGKTNPKQGRILTMSSSKVSCRGKESVYSHKRIRGRRPSRIISKYSTPSKGYKQTIDFCCGE